MKKFIKKLSTTLISIVVVIFTISANTIVTKAADNPSFLPFRADYVNYISQNSSAKSDIVQKIWLKLFYEETHWSKGQTYYTAGYAKWSNKYYGNYIGADGKTRSSKGVQTTYNPAFDGFLYSTLTANEDFVINWINENPDVFAKYCKDAKSHPFLADAIIKITSSTNTSQNYLGSGKDSKNNLFEYGKNVTGANKHGGKGPGPKWTNSGTRESWHDIDVLRILGSKWSKLSQTQKNWVITYLPWLVDNYISNKNNGIASPSNSNDLYKLMAESGYGMTKPQVNQEFFNYCISNGDAFVGNLIVNGATTYGCSGTLRTNDVNTNSDMNAIWAADADCDYNSAWAGGSGKGLGDNDYDWLAYQICFGTDSFYSTLRNLVAGNSDTNPLMQDWLMRYYVKHPTSGSGEMANAVAKAGTTEGITLGKFVVGSCGRLSTTDGKAWDCQGHIDNSPLMTYNKPLGVKSVVLRVHSDSPQFTYSKSLGYKIYDSANGNVIAQGGGVEVATVEIPAAYIWSSTIVIEVSGTVYQGHIGHNSGGGCWGTTKGAEEVARGNTNIRIPYHAITADYTYTDFDHCTKHGHSFIVSGYNWASDYSKCTATITCPNCGKSYQVTDSNVVVNNYSDKITYTANFPHTSEVAPKTATTLKGSKTKTYTTYNLDGKPQGTGKGTCSLPNSKIGIGAKKMTVSVTASEATIKVMNKYGQEISSRTLSTGAPTSEELIAIFDFSGLSDEKCDGMYVIVNMSATVRYYSRIGYYLGTRDGNYSLNRIVIEY